MVSFRADHFDPNESDNESDFDEKRFRYDNFASGPERKINGYRIKSWRSYLDYYDLAPTGD